MASLSAWKYRFTIDELIPSRKRCLTFPHRLGIMGTSSLATMARRNPVRVRGPFSRLYSQMDWESCRLQPIPTTKLPGEPGLSILGRCFVLAMAVTEWNAAQSKPQLCRPATGCRMPRLMRLSRYAPAETERVAAASCGEGKRKRLVSGCEHKEQGKRTGYRLNGLAIF